MKAFVVPLIVFMNTVLVSPIYAKQAHMPVCPTAAIDSMRNREAIIGNGRTPLPRITVKLNLSLAAGFALCAEKAKVSGQGYKGDPWYFDQMTAAAYDFHAAQDAHQLSESDLECRALSRSGRRYSELKAATPPAEYAFAANSVPVGLTKVTKMLRSDCRA